MTLKYIIHQTNEHSLMKILYFCLKNMITFLVSIGLLLAGYFFYSRLLERIFVVDTALVTPAYSLADGIDYVPMSWPKIFLIQFLNIAGLGPIFGALLGAMYGPVAFLWIVFGNILGGAMHDYFSGMLSVRKNGLSLPEIVGEYLGKGFLVFMRGFTLFLMILVGAVFVIGPAKIIDGMTSGFLPMWAWITLIFSYYILATIMPVDKIIGRIYPFMGFALFFMAAGILLMILLKGLAVPELSLATFHNFRPDAAKFPVFPMMFVTIACGAVSGFHSTQSPLMARCLKNEKDGRRVFYGAMVAEGVVALIWAAAGMAFWGGVKELNEVMIAHKENAAWAVNEISLSLLGKFGAILALIGVVAAPITSGDTAFRSARLIVADFLKFPQKSLKNRILISLPVFIAGFILSQAGFGIIWRYMAWSNQTLATIVLWTISVYLAINNKFYMLALIPALFMTAVCSAYLFVSPEGFSLPLLYGYAAAFVISACSLVFFFRFVRIRKKNA